jgi:putative ABC transport system ATP-binding protein
VDDLQNPWAIHADHVSHFFGEGEARRQVLIDINLKIQPGEIVIMTGPSGSGKTTLLTLIGALRTVQKGELTVLGRPLHSVSPTGQVEVRRRIGFIFQGHNLLQSLTARENIEKALELEQPNGRLRRERAFELLERLGLRLGPRTPTDERLEPRERTDDKPEKLSGGQKQRVAIARALANRPALILADEPTAALDEHWAKEVIGLLKSLATEDKATVLIVTHDNRILSVADRIVNMVDGRVISNASVKETAAIAELLKRCTALEMLTPSTLTRVAEKMDRETFKAGTIVFRQGDLGDKFYLIRKGMVDIIKDLGLPTEQHLAVLTAGQFFGEIALMSVEGRRIASVVAKTELDVYTLDKPNFLAAREASPTLWQEVMTAFMTRQ